MSDLIRVGDDFDLAFAVEARDSKTGFDSKKRLSSGTPVEIVQVFPKTKSGRRIIEFQVSGTSDGRFFRAFDDEVVKPGSSTAKKHSKMMGRNPVEKKKPGKVSRFISSKLAQAVDKFNDKVQKAQTGRNPKDKRKQVVFMMGLPAAGKSSVAKKFYGGRSNWRILDSDEILAEIFPNFDRSFSDEEEAERLVTVAKKELEKRYQAALRDGTKNIVYDSTASNVNRVKGNMKLASDAGYQNSLFYVTVPIETSLKRNEERFKRGGRLVPEAIIKETAEKIDKSFNALKGCFDNLLQVDNSGRQGSFREIEKKGAGAARNPRCPSCNGVFRNPSLGRGECSGCGAQVMIR